MQNIPNLSRNPLYLQVRQYLIKKIQSGDWQPGEKIPTEPSLATQFGVSIGTIRKAVDTLVNDGFILRKEGSGTFVKTYKDAGYWNPFQIFRDLNGNRRGSRCQLILFEKILPPERISKALLADNDQEFIHIIRHWFHTFNGIEQLVSIDESYLMSSEFKGLTQQRFQDSFLKQDSLYRFYDREFGIVIFNQRCSTYFEKIPSIEANLLQVPEGLEVLRTDRVSYTFGHKPVEYRINRGNVEFTKLLFDLNVV